MHQSGDVISGRYRIVRLLGTGGSGLTYEAEEIGLKRQVALKALSLRGLQDWKQLELFEREAQVLQNLDHPAIPDYIDYFQVDSERDRRFYIAQELAEGQSLAALVEAGWRVSEAEVKQIALAVLKILDYLHRLNPPIIHRDIKPQNIIRREDGAIFLVDFGAVQHVYHSTISQGGTVVGTYGYMAPEQFRGVAYPSSDLYSLAATLLFLLTHRSPADLPQRRLKIDFRSEINTSPELADWLESMLEPAMEDRLSTAQESIAALTQPRSPLVSSSGANTGAMRRHQPKGSQIKLARTRSQLTLEIPPVGLRTETLTLGGFAIFWNGFVLLWTIGATWGAASSGFWIFPLFSIPFWLVGFGMAAFVLNGLLGRTRLEINWKQFRLERQLLGWQRQVSGEFRDLAPFELRTAYSQDERPVKAITLVEGINTHKFGTMLSSAEKEWLLQELNQFIETAREHR
ncbi:serine/threonine protein kinase [Almyronema epifaneia]|uniref:non-specific serine/threonine protein kinase n=1 Tax=Almyronema epifaneia S1 TaxID=2991925 RepID=A0ABW6IK84_9CYAN